VGVYVERVRESSGSSGVCAARMLTELLT